MKKKWINLFLACLITTGSAAQTTGFKFHSVLDTVKTTAFYNITLTPEVNARLKPDNSDLRIVNHTGQWIPHIVHNPAKNRAALPLPMDLKFSVIENSGLNTVILIESGQTISSNIGLIITNTVAERFCTISGSNDKKNWFVINDSILINPVATPDATESVFSISFPPNKYPYYKLQIRNNHKDPFNIRGVMSVYQSPDAENPLNKAVENPVVQIRQKDSGKVSYIIVKQDLPYPFDHVSLQVGGVKYYSRRVDLYIPYSADYSFSDPGRLLHSFTISNNSTLGYKIPAVKSQVFLLLIHNEDNLPLTVNEVKTAYPNRYITAYLETGDRYWLMLDNEDAEAPNYDITEFKKNIPDSLSFLGFGKLTATAETAVVAAADKKSAWVLWLVIGGTLSILIFFTYRMLAEVDKNKTT